LLLFVAERLAGLNGGVITTIDTLFALLTLDMPVTILSRDRCELPGEWEGKRIQTPEWLIADQGEPLRPRIDRDLPRRTARWMRDAWSDFAARKRVRRLRPDLLIVADVFSHRFLEDFGDWSGCPRVITLLGVPREMTGQFLGGGWDYDRIVREIASYSSAVCLTNREREQWDTVRSLDHVRKIAIPGCCREEVAARLLAEDRLAVRRRLGIPDDRFVAVCAASLQRRKGQDILLDYLPRLKDAIPNFLLYLVGPVVADWGGREVIDRIEAEGYKDYVRVTGPREDAMDFTYAADVAVLPSRAEAQGIVVVEAMALKTPVIASDVDGIPDMIEHGVSGLLFSHDRRDGLLEAFVKLAKDERLRKSLAEEACRKYWKAFARSHHVEQWRRFVTETLMEKR
jgi:glycosyltransferase involved in cell wall biosynthesis